MLLTESTRGREPEEFCLRQAYLLPLAGERGKRSWATDLKAVKRWRWSVPPLPISAAREVAGPQLAG